jgi:hypothetical protein
LREKVDLLFAQMQLGGDFLDSAFAFGELSAQSG